MTGNLKTPGLDPVLHEYLVAHGSPPDALLEELTATTRNRFGRASEMQVAPEQGAFLRMLTRLLGVERAVEVGTFTGYSSINIARGLRPGGRLTCLDASEEFTAVAREFWDRAGVADLIDLHVGDGVEGLRALPPEPHIDLAFIDAAKDQYIDYYEELVVRLNPGGVILVDNVLWSGEVVNDDNQQELTLAVRAFNDHVVEDHRTDAVMLPIADGLTLITHAD